jgi:molybdopterin molybdotransferase
MPRVSAYPMVTVGDALQTILDRAEPLGVETVNLLHARGRILARDVMADDDLPGLPRSSVDGYAVLADDPADTFEVLEEVTAGRLAQVQVRPGTAVRIMTGGTLPSGADAVVMVEEVEESADGQAVLQKRPRQGENVHPPGMDLTRGQQVLTRGSRVGSAEVGLLATVGCIDVPVYRRPKVAVLATGDELVEPHQTPPPGAVRDSNRFALIAAAQEAGAEVVWHHHARDEEAELERAICAGLDAADVLLTSGGVSMGTRDLIKPLLEKLATIEFGRVSFKPGKPLTFASRERQLIFGLPGFPVSSLVTFEVFVRPALMKLSGAAQVLRPRVSAKLGHDLRPDAIRPEYQRAVVGWEKDQFVARTTGLQSSSRLMSIVGANALLEIEPGDQPLLKGTIVPALLLANL